MTRLDAAVSGHQCHFLLSTEVDASSQPTDASAVTDPHLQHHHQVRWFRDEVRVALFGIV